MTNEPIITINNLQHFFGAGSLRRQVLYDISLELQGGEFVIMTGPSGSGKSTLLSLIGCLRSVQFGSLKFLGQELQGADDSVRKRVRNQFGYVFQASNLVQFLTAEKNIHLSLELHSHLNRHQIKTRTQEILDAVGLGDYGHYYPNQLSGGQKQRIAIACALVTLPKLVLADEPTAALDSHSGQAIVELMGKLAKDRGSAVLMVTHDQRILGMADRIIRVEDGRLGLDYRQEIALALPGLQEKDFAYLDFDPTIETFSPGSYVIRQGDEVNHFYIILKGKLEVIIETESGSKTQVMKTLKRGDYFGEIGLLQGCKRTASVKVISEEAAELMMMEREIFLKLIGQSKVTEVIMAQQIEQKILSNILTTSLPALDSQEILDLLPAVKTLYYGSGSIILNQGDLANLFYVLLEGSLEVVRRCPDGAEVLLCQLEPGEYFGEIALVKETNRTSTIRVVGSSEAKLLVLDRLTFQQLLDRSSDLKSEINATIEKRLKEMLNCSLNHDVLSANSGKKLGYWLLERRRNNQNLSDESCE